MGGHGSGGKNKTHSTVEDYPRLDSFALCSSLMGDKYLHCKEEVCYPSSRQPDVVYHVRTREYEILTSAYYSPLHLEKVPGVNGRGARVFFHCPHCGRRCRYLYKNQCNYMCRNCLGANYKIQQRNGRKKMILRMKKIVEDHLDYKHWRMDNPGKSIHELRIIPRPRYMRFERYVELLEEYRQLQDDYEVWILRNCFQYCPPEVAAILSRYN